MKKSMVFEGLLVIALALLCFIAYLMVTAGGHVQEQWNLTSSEPVYYLAMGNGGLYAFSDNSVMFLDASAKDLWTFRISPEWKILLDGWNYPLSGNSQPPVTDVSSIYATDNGTLYLYAIDNTTWPGFNSSEVFQVWAYEYYTNDSQLFDLRDKKIMAISSNGNELWNYTVREGVALYGPDGLKAHGGRVYFHHADKETVLDSSGNVLFTLDNVSDPVSVDDEGNIYAVKDQFTHAVGIDSMKEILNRSSFGVTDISSIPYYVPSSVIESFYPNGTLRWETDLSPSVNGQYLDDISSRTSRQYLDASIRNEYDGLPLYRNGMLYVPKNNGIIALYTNGTESWRKLFAETDLCLLEAMPFDADGNIYLRQGIKPYVDDRDLISFSGAESYIIILSPDGKNISNKVTFNYYGNPVSVGDGVIYTTRQAGNTTSGLLTDEISASNLTSGAFLWSYRIPVEDERTVASHVASGLSVDRHSWPFNNPVFDPPISANTTDALSHYKGNISGSYAIVLPAGDKIYVNFRSVRLEYQPANSLYNITYSNGIYALDRSGNLLWYKSPDSPVTAMAANNSTIVYGTRGGGLSAYTIGLAGVTLAALSYFFIRFFLIGAVSRARDRLGINDNRNKVLDYVRSHPASTLSDISKNLKMNLGTVRYHMLILGINHRVLSMRADDRFVRYFTNSGSYSKEQQILMSLLKREGARKVLEGLLEMPGMSNVELSKRLNISEVAVSKSIKVLLENGIVQKEPVDGKTNAYFINKNYGESIAYTMERMNSL
jgi:predicted transcriptional regulator